MPNPRFNGYSYKDSFMSQFCDTRDAMVQEMMLCIGYGVDAGIHSMTPSEYFASVVMGDAFTRDMDECDKAMWQLVDDEEQPRTAICIHRGGGKTTAMQAKMARAICLRQYRYILYIQATHDDAAFQTENLKGELLSNDFITDHFGVMKAKEYDGQSKDFSKKAWFACNPENAKNKPGEPFAFVLPRGAQQRVRGRNLRLLGARVRPDFILIDDLEDDEEVLNEANRVKLRNWYFGALLETVDQTVPLVPETQRWGNKPRNARANWAAPWRVFHVDTLKHHDALMAHLLTHGHWKSCRFPLGEEIETIDDNGNKTYHYITRRPKFRTNAEVQAEAENAKIQGTLDVFCREKLCQPAARQHATFHQSMFQHYPQSEDVLLNDNPGLYRCVVVDPSKSASMSADFTGMMATAIDQRMARINVRYAKQRKLTGNQVIVEALKLCVETNSRELWVEKIGMEEPQQANWINAIASMGVDVNLCWLTIGHTPPGDYAKGGDGVKVWRAQQAAIFYERKEVWHNIELAGGDLEKRLLEYPRMTDFGLTDCVGYIPAIMDERNIVFDRQVERYKNMVRFEPVVAHTKLKSRILAGAWAV